MLLFSKAGAAGTGKFSRRTLAPVFHNPRQKCSKNNASPSLTFNCKRHQSTLRTLKNKRYVVKATTSADEKTYSVEDAKSLVETAMLAAIGGLAYLVSAVLKFDTALSYVLPLPIILASLRTGHAAGWSVMTATMFLLIVLMGPLRAVSYILLHGLMAATLGSLWRRGCNFWLVLFTVGAVRMLGQLTYLGLSSAVMRENFFSFILSNVYAMLDQVAVVINIGGTPSPLVVVIVMLNLMLVNNVTFCFVLQVAYRAFLSRMGYDVGQFPPYIQQVIFGNSSEGGGRETTEEQAVTSATSSSLTTATTTTAASVLDVGANEAHPSASKPV